MNALAQLQSALSGRYAVEREIGAGGMATVYLARDLRHNRRVALKVLNPELGAVLGIERFLSEIQVTANLQHPNLLPLFDSGEADGLLFYVMPFVEGESLRARLDREKQMPIDEAVRMAVAVAGALEYAHEHGVVHRDLKPENILIQAGQAVVADFGIALAVSNAGGNRVTQSGLSLGTPQYMSPEQATGDRGIDRRSDIYSLGAVLYEMLSGDPPYVGSTAQAIIARLLTERPRSLISVRETVPAHVDATIDRALAKLPADRFATAREFAEALQGMRPIQLSVRAQAPAVATEAMFVRVDGRRRALAIAPWVVAALAVVALVWREMKRPAVDRAPVRFTVVDNDSAAPREDLNGSNIGLSPDGNEVLYVGGSRAALISRRLDALETKTLRVPTGSLTHARFSPDGKWIAFNEQSIMYKMPAGGGPAVKVVDSASRFSWGDRDQIVFVKNGLLTNDGLWVVSAAGGPVEHLTRPDTANGISGHTWPSVLAGSRGVVLTVSHGTSVAASELAVMSFDDRIVRPLGIPGVSPMYVRSGHLVFGRLDGTIAAVPFDLERLRVTGPAVTVLENVVVKGGGAVEIAVSPNGTLAYVSGAEARDVRLVDSTGNVTPLITAHLDYLAARFSPNGDRVVFSARDESGNPDIWVFHLATRSVARLTNDGKSTNPEWTPDGRRISWLYRDSTRSELRWQNADGSSAPQVLVTPKDPQSGAAWAPSGRYFLSVTGRAGRTRVFRVPVDSEPQLLLSGQRAYLSPAISRDGKWLAFTSNESGAGEVYVQPTSGGGGGRHQISLSGGASPRWSLDGRTLYYRESGIITAARLQFAPHFLVTRRDTLFADRLTRPGAPGATFDVSPVDGRFLIVGRGTTQPKLIVVLNWLDELRERMASTAKK